MPNFPGFDNYNPEKPSSVEGNSGDIVKDIPTEVSSGVEDEILDLKLELEGVSRYNELAFNQEISSKIAQVHVLLKEVRHLYGVRLQNRIEVDSKKKWLEEPEIHEFLDPRNLPKVRVDVKHAHLKDQKTRRFIKIYEEMKRLNELLLASLG